MEFNRKTRYIDCIESIGEALKLDDTHESFQNFAHKRGFDYLTSITDSKEQSYMVQVLRKIDSELDFSGEKSGMYRKLPFFLKAGILYGEHKAIVENIPSDLLGFLVCEAPFLISNREETAKMLPIYADSDFLNEIKERAPVYSHCVMSAMMQHFEKMPFDTDDMDKVKAFRKSELERYDKDKLEFRSDVEDYQAMYSRISRELNEEGKSRK